MALLRLTASILALAAARAAPRGCRSDGDCLPAAGVPQPLDFRCVNASNTSGAALPCHLAGPATEGNATCLCAAAGACDPDASAATYPPTPWATGGRYLMIGDSVSQGMAPAVFATLNASSVAGFHNADNGNSASWGARELDCWLQAAPSATGPDAQVWDVISFNFGLHDIAYDTERISVEQYASLLANVTARLGDVQARDGTRLLYVTTTPVPTVPRYEWPGDDCTNVSACLNPPRFDADVALYNEAALGVLAASGAEVATLDLYGYVADELCGGAGYARCDGVQLANNVHFTDDGYALLAAKVSAAVLAAARAR